MKKLSQIVAIEKNSRRVIIILTSKPNQNPEDLTREAILTLGSGGWSVDSIDTGTIERQEFWTVIRLETPAGGLRAIISFLWRAIRIFAPLFRKKPVLSDQVLKCIQDCPSYDDSPVSGTTQVTPPAWRIYLEDWTGTLPRELTTCYELAPGESLRDLEKRVELNVFAANRMTNGDPTIEGNSILWILGPIPDGVGA